MGESSETLVILADDLTGAADAAVAFTRICSDVRVDIHIHAPRPGAVVAWSSDTRDTEPARLKQRIHAVLHNLPESAILFKKVDSVFRGNTFAEIREVLRTSDYDLAVLAPAYPQVGRRIEKGVLYVDGISEAEPMNLIHELPEMPLLPTGLAEAQIEARFRVVLNQRQRAVLCDANTQEHLEAVVRVVRSLQVRTLWIGSGGLAHALAATSSASPLSAPVQRQRKPAGIVCYFIGSDHPVTLRQMERLQSRYEGGSYFLKKVLRGYTSEPMIRGALREAAERPIGALVMTGGDTAGLVCRALGITAIRLSRELVPGVPVGTAVGGAYDGTPLLLKSGGFGPEELLCDIQAQFSDQEIYL